MKKSRFTQQERLAVLAKQESGVSVEDVCREYQISPATFYKWKREIADEQDEEKREFNKLKAENARLKKMYAELRIDYDILSEGYEIAKKISARTNKKK